MCENSSGILLPIEKKSSYRLILDKMKINQMLKEPKSIMYIYMYFEWMDEEKKHMALD